MPAPQTSENPSCPKCGKTMAAAGRTSGGAQRWRCRDRVDGRERRCFITTDPEGRPRTQGVKTAKIGRVLDPRTKVFICSWAQNATQAHPVFLKIIEQIRRHRGGEIAISNGRYKNPTSHWTASQENDERWDPALAKYLYDGRGKLNSGLVFAADIKVQPTTGDPVGRFASITGALSTIIGHPKIAMRSFPAPLNRMPKVVLTTGAVTRRNYTDTAVGKAGEFHHTLGCLIVEVAAGGRFHARQVLFDSKTQSAIDLDTRYYADRRVKAPRPAALVMGDTHVGVHSPDVDVVTFGRGGIVPTLRPHHLVWHDLFDGHSVNPHHLGDPIAAQAKFKGGVADVAKEIRQACKFVRERTTGDMKSVIVVSNHNKFLDRWINSHDWRDDPANAEVYLETALKMVRGVQWGPGGVRRINPMKAAFEALVPMGGIKVLEYGEKFSLKGIDLDMHGHLGPNGSRGSAKALRRIGVKSIIGHSHGPCIEEGCCQVGCGTGIGQNGLDYGIEAPSSSLNCHCILHDDGKRQMILIIDRHWRG